MSRDQQPPGQRRRDWRRRRAYTCHCCRRQFPYCFNCPCGFAICEACFQENRWGLTNGPTWVCPDCGRVRML